VNGTTGPTVLWWKSCRASFRAPGIVQSLVRLEDLIVNRGDGPNGLAEHFGAPLETVQTVPAFDDRARVLPSHIG
jgi:hypothetical protein